MVGIFVLVLLADNFFCGTREFNLNEFKANPTLAQVHACRVVDLMLTATWLGVDMPLVARKSELRELVVTALQETSLIGAIGVEDEEKGPSVVPPPAVPPVALLHTTVPTDPVNVSGMSAEELRLMLHIREMELEAMHLKVKLLELERQPMVPPQSPELPSPCDSFDVSRHIALVPPFREAEVDSYFSAFERIAPTLNWPKDVWSLLLQCKLMGKAQEVCAALSVEQN